jgi:hypothetical protein
MAPPSLPSPIPKQGQRSLSARLPAHPQRTPTTTNSSTCSSPRYHPTSKKIKLAANTVSCGANAKTFSLGNYYLCKGSPFFKAAFNSQFLEGEMQNMVLDDIDTNLFGLFIK